MAKKHEFKVGDFARNVESGWLGKIVEILPPQKVWIDDTRFFEETMANMVGVDEIACMVAGVPWEQGLSDNDTQQHSLDDLVPAKRKAA
jgi:hypothetical protein